MFLYDVGSKRSFVLLIFHRLTYKPISLVRYVILAIYVAKIDFIVFMASLGVK